MKTTKNQRLAKHIATTILRTGTTGENTRIALMQGKWPDERDNGGLCKDALIGVIVTALRSYKPKLAASKSPKQ